MARGSLHVPHLALAVFGSVQPDVIASIMDGLFAALPAAKGLGIAYQWCCFRPRHPDRRPVIDHIPGLDNAWLT